MGEKLTRVFPSGTYSFFPIKDNAGAHNAFYRGDDITEYFNSGAMSTVIANGTFKDIFPGDYIIKNVTIDGNTYNNVKWVIMDCDYFFNSGDIPTTTHHVILMPEGYLGKAQMNETNTTEGGYLNSKIWTDTIPLINIGIKSAFGNSHILSHRELLTSRINNTAISGGIPTRQGCSDNYDWVSVESNICNENQIYGIRSASSSMFDTADCYRQFIAFKFINSVYSSKYTFWLRSIATNTWFCCCGSYNDAGYSNASSSIYVRPYFLLI